MWTCLMNMFLENLNVMVYNDILELCAFNFVARVIGGCFPVLV